jgi:hypothetical protein
VLEQNTGVLLVDADGILDSGRSTSAVDEVSVHVVDSTLAVASQAQAVGHVATTVLAQIEGMLPLMRVFRVTVRDHHLRERQAPEDGSLSALIIEGDVAQDDTLTVVEANMNLPLLPAQSASINREGDTLGLGDVDRLEIGTETTLSLNCCSVVVVGSGPVDRSSDGRDINVDDLLGVGVEDGAEVEGEAVLAVVDVRAVVHESLLKANVAAKTLVISNGPRCKQFKLDEGEIRRARVLTIAVDFVHILGRNANDATLLDDLGVFPADALDNLEIFHRNL